MQCKRCGKCCDLAIQAPFVLPKDIRLWMALDRWNIIRSLMLVEGQNHEQEITFRRQADGHCTWYKNHSCLIYKLRPLACSIYPTTKPCHQGIEPSWGNAAMKIFSRARREWERADVTWRQEHFIELQRYVVALNT